VALGISYGLACHDRHWSVDGDVFPEKEMVIAIYSPRTMPSKKGGLKRIPVSFHPEIDDFRMEHSAISSQLSEISDQRSAISYQLL
jgi:hypothetical protein